MTRYLYLIVLGLLALALASCGGGNDDPATTGTVSGDIDVVGPSNGAVEMNVGLFASGSDTPLQTGVAGRVSSAATVSLSGRQLNFSFSEVEPGTYSVRVFATSGGDNTYFYTSEAFTTTEASPSKTFSNEECSFSGNGPFGGISGIALLEGSTDFPNPAETVTFIGVAPASNPQAALQWVVSADDLRQGNWVKFDIGGLAYGTYLLGFYGYNPATHALTTYGQFDQSVTINAAADYVTTAVFPASFTGDPGTDPALGTISGTVTFTNGEAPEDLYLAIAANTVPPQQGAPPASFDVIVSEIGEDGTLDYVLPSLPDGDYGVSIFAYNVVTHQATYFGEFGSSITIEDGSRDITGVNFDADVSIISGN